MAVRKRLGYPVWVQAVIHEAKDRRLGPDWGPLLDLFFSTIRLHVAVYQYPFPTQTAVQFDGIWNYNFN